MAMAMTRRKKTMKKRAGGVGEEEEGEMEMMDGCELERLPDAVMQAILTRLDILSIYSAASCCRFLRSTVAQLLPYLESFHLLDISPDNELLEQLLSGNLLLRSIKLDCSLLDDRVIDSLTKPHLQELSLHCCEGFSVELLLGIGRCCQDLRSLSLELGWHDDEEGDISYSEALEVLLKNCSFLESLSLKFEGSIFNAVKLGARFRLIVPALKVLEIGYVAERLAINIFQPLGKVGSAPQAQAPHIGFKDFQHLRILCLLVDHISDSVTAAISQSLPSLLELELLDEPSEEPSLAYDLTNAGLQSVGCCQMLRRLCLVRGQEWYPASFKRVNDLGIFLMIESCKYLENIRLGGFSRITDAGCRAMLHSSSRLHTFEILNTSQLTDLAFHDLPATPLTLTSVSLTSCLLISNCSVKNLSFCRSLEKLNLRGCRSIGDEGLKAISGLTKLKVLNLNGSDVSDSGLRTLGTGITPLVSLSLRGCQRITDNGVAVLLTGRIPQTLEAIDLSYILALTDTATLSLVRSRMQIAELRLRDCPHIGDTSVIALASMQCKGRCHGGSLRLLDLWNCKGVTKISVSWFRRPYFPNLRRLGLSWVLNEDMQNILVKDRPSIQITWQGSELGHVLSGEPEWSHNSLDYEEDELERWLEDSDS
ncbi:hypothetical protein O6H91_08G081800 [Diphasiastrum complanatum]|uniref:Uncharacterized protein n=1 Tax=Diphasiastrum complanatum TaxID=34168 RepID=A0ACC2CZ96_DIPCM|nr:hypothetical protein O6H91_08G081800 [Diphasiastrum complanatum]